MSSPPTFFQRFILPGFAFKAVVIGGGYATGRELAEFFLPHGPWGGVFAMLFAAAIWSLVCVVTFLFAQVTRSRDYRTFFRHLLGPFWWVFEAAYFPFTILVLSVFGAAAGAIGQAMAGVPTIVGTLCLIAGIALIATFGNKSVEEMFKYVSFFLYATYAVFLILALTTFGDRVADSFARPVPAGPWPVSGITYASYNILGAAIILPMLRHLTSRRDAVIAGALCGPLAMAPALLFFCCIAAFYPEIARETLPSDFLLGRLGIPVFHLIFQLMIFSALLESGTGSVHAINERLAAAYERRGRSLSRWARLGVSMTLLIVSIFIADRFGLVTLIASGYRGLAYVLLAIYILPLLSYGVWRLYVLRTVEIGAAPVQPDHAG